MISLAPNSMGMLLFTIFLCLIYLAALVWFMIIRKEKTGKRKA